MIREVLTHPKEHDKDNFIYLVHGILDWNGNGISSHELREKLKRINDPNQFYRASLIAHLNEGSARKRFGYHGEITQSGTFGDIGVILNPVNEESLYIAWNCDLGSPWDPVQLKEYAQKHRGKRKYPLALLTQTVGPSDIKYNELILQGDEDTLVQGVFFREDDVKTKDKARMLTNIACEISQKDLPAIELSPYPKPFYESISDPKEREIAIQCEVLRTSSEIMQAQKEFRDFWERKRENYNFGHSKFKNPLGFDKEFTREILDPDTIKRIKEYISRNH